MGKSNQKSLNFRKPISARKRFAFEQLEPRLALDAAGFLTGNDVHLTLSFAADGTQIAGQSNQLASLFNAIAPTNVWQESILTAFQTWAVNTNADIGVVADGGQPFGTAGPSQRDDRFGDIRIGAIAMAPNVAAVSVPVDGLVSGTWFTDVLFNTEYNYQSLDDILAIALHEAGNVFGLDDNADPNSPLFPGDPPVVRAPTATDISLLQQLYGVRAPDVNEMIALGNNDSIASATILGIGETENGSSGSAPTVLYGDITTAADLDYFKVYTPGGYHGNLTIEIRSSGISLLKPRLRVFDATQQIVSEISGTSVSGSLVSFQLTSVDPDEQYYFEISGADPGIQGIGGYSLAMIFDDANLVERSKIDEVAGGKFRFLSAEDLAKFFDSEEDFYNDDNHTDDDFLGAVELDTVHGFVEGTRYETIGSINDSTDADYYGVASPQAATGPLSVMTLAVRSLDPAGLIPQVSLFDEDLNPIPFTILANGGGDYIVQAVGIAPGDDLLVKVEAGTPGGLFSTGNYSLVVTFGAVATQFESLELNPLPTIGGGVTQRVHTLHIGEPQLFHFLLEAGDVPVAAPTVLVATIYNDQGVRVHQFSAHPGETHSREAVLLAPGSYTINVTVLTLAGVTPPVIPYNIRWTALSDPFVGDPNDPTGNPFACPEPGMEGMFCYPGEIVSPDPYLWGAFIGSLSDPPTGLSLGETITLLFGDWWTWVWAEFGENGPVFASNDVYHGPPGSTLTVAGGNSANSGNALTVGAAQGLLSNDFDPENGNFVAFLQTDVSHGTLNLQADGGFTYTPDPGFRGTDQFTYIAYDFGQQSNVGTVSIVIGDSGDFDANGTVNGRDFLAWQRGYGIAAGATLTDGDANLDSVVDNADLAIWQDQYQGVATPTPSYGDADGDGDVDGRDFLAWQRGFGIAQGATAAQGDANADGAVNGADLGEWQVNYGNGFSAPLAALSEVLTSEVVSQPPLTVPLLAEPVLVQSSSAQQLARPASPIVLSLPVTPSPLSRHLLVGGESEEQIFSDPTVSGSELDTHTLTARQFISSSLASEQTTRDQQPQANARHRAIDRVFAELGSPLLSLESLGNFRFRRLRD